MLLQAAAAVLAVLGAVSIFIFYQYLDITLFQERSAHFIEISDKVTQVVESVVERYRSVASIAENLLAQSESGTIPDRLEDIRVCLGLEEGTVLAFDQDAQFYASDGTVSNWRDTSALTNGADVQELVTALAYRADNASYILFLRRLPSPLRLEGTAVTHLGLAVDASVFHAAFDTDVFQGQSHIYLSSPNGRRLYRYTHAGNFIDGYNILTALEPCSFVHGGTVDDLRSVMEARASGSYEFLYDGEPYFVAASPVRQTEWAVLTFVPTQALGAGTTAFMNNTVIYLSAIAALAVAMLGLVMFLLVAKQGDRRLIEHQRKANELLQDAAAAANAASVAKSDFLSHMSHDIRTPINGIMGMTDIALKNLDDRARVLDCLEKIEGASGHLLSLVNDVLDMSRIERGKTRIAHDPMDLRQVIEHCASIVGGQLEGRDVALLKEFEALAHPHVFGDELHLRQALINILGNAVKFTPDGGNICFRVKELSSDGAQAQFRLEIEDTGIGMSPEFIPHIFEAFAQEEDGGRTHYKGTGLGMAITKQFIDLMGGSIAVESRLNEGSRFVVELSLDLDLDYREAAESGGSRTSLAGAHLLLAEDNELNLEIAQYILEDEGIQITAAEDGQAAVDAFLASPAGTFDGILMDVMMPVMDGLAATRAIRALDRPDAKTVPIIAMTANAYDEDKRRCLEAGMNAHVAKPIDAGALVQVLAHYIKPENGRV